MKRIAVMKKADLKGCATVLLILALSGCLRSIKIEKNDPVVLTTNGVSVVVEGGYSLKYRAIGLKTDVSSIKAHKTKDGLEIEVDGVKTDVSTENKELVSSTGTAVGNVAQKVIDGVKGIDTIKTSK